MPNVNCGQNLERNPGLASDTSIQAATKGVPRCSITGGFVKVAKRRKLLAGKDQYCFQKGKVVWFKSPHLLRCDLLT